MPGELSKNFHGVGNGPLSKILIVKSNNSGFKKGNVDFLKSRVYCIRFILSEKHTKFVKIFLMVLISQSTNF
jgi:hypothetical protein